MKKGKKYTEQFCFHVTTQMCWSMLLWRLRWSLLSSSQPAFVETQTEKGSCWNFIGKTIWYLYPDFYLLICHWYFIVFFNVVNKPEKCCPHISNPFFLVMLHYFISMLIVKPIPMRVFTEFHRNLCYFFSKQNNESIQVRIYCKRFN